MTLITSTDRKKLLANRAKRTLDPKFDPKPVVHLSALFVPWTWLLVELDPRNEDLALGLCDLGAGHPEYGTVSVSELENFKMGPMPIVERIPDFKARAPLSAYFRDAKIAGKIVL